MLFEVFAKNTAEAEGKVFSLAEIWTSEYWTNSLTFDDDGDT